MIGANTSSDGDFELLCLCEALGGQVTGVEAGESEEL